MKKICPPILAAAAFGMLGIAAHAADPLPSWNDTAPKKAIIAFVEKVTNEGGPDFVPPDQRIATFDNDGTLWAEQPMYFQLLFALHRVGELAPQHPEWKDKEPFASLLKGDAKAALAGGERTIGEIIMVTHAGMSTDAFEKIVEEWITTAKHPITKRPILEMIYQPMIELLAYLRANGFKTFIVSGGGIEFMRPWTERIYGVQPQQVVGSSIKTKYDFKDGKPVLMRLPEINFIDDKTGKPIGINQHIGRRPIMAFGNSDGDQQMLEYTGAGSGARYCLLVHHDDAEREWAYGPESKIGTFSDALMSEAEERGWTVISMKNDWKQVFAFDKADLDAVTAIDILLEPDATMLKHAQAVNDRLRKVFPKGFALDATHRPHVSLVQRFVLTENLDKVYAAVRDVFASASVPELKLEAFKYYYIPDKDLGLSGIVIKPTPELLKLEQQVIDAVTPFAVRTGTSAAFVTTPEDPQVLPALITYVSEFVPKHSGENYHPHVTTGLAPRTYLDEMLNEPFETFTFSPVGSAVYHLGDFGTAAKKLKQFDLQP